MKRPNVLHLLGWVVPGAAMLQVLDFAEIDRPHQGAGRVDAAEIAFFNAQ